MRGEAGKAKRVLGALGGVAAGVAVCALCGGFGGAALAGAGLSQQGAVCLGILSWAIVWWVAGVLPEFATGLLMAGAFIVLGGIPTQTALAAFSTSTWWLLVAAFALGAGMKRSGLMRRMALGIVRRLPRSFAAQAAGIMAAGTLIGPLVPSMAAKASMLAPISMSIGESLGYEPKGRQMQGLFLAMMTGVRNAGPAFISASVTGYALLGLLPAAVQEEFNMLHWLVAALPWLAVVTLLNLGLIIALYRPRSNEGSRADATSGGPALSSATSAEGSLASDSAQPEPCAGRASAAADPAAPGTPMSREERRMLAIIVVTVILWASQPVHGIPSHVVALVAMVVMVAAGLLDKRSLKTDIAWDSLIFIGTVIGLADVFAFAGIDSWVVGAAGPLLGQLAGNPYALLLGIAVSTIALRFVIVSEMAYVNIVMVFLVPLSVSAGISPWVVGFAVYATVHPWFVLYQNPIYMAAFYSVDGAMVRHADMAKYCSLYMLTCVAGLLASVPYWQFLGLLG
ncbi:MAG: SLC13 family permease [Coriobacteriales bacterium]